MTRILVPFDGSESGERAVRRAAEIALERQADVIVLHVLPTTFEREKVAQIDPASVDEEEHFARGIVDQALGILAENGVRGEGMVAGGPPALVILDQIRELRPALVVMGSRGLQEVMPEGSVSRKVRAAADVPVEVVD